MGSVSRNWHAQRRRNPGAGDVVYEYAAKGGSEWTDVIPTAPGEYTVRATVNETRNYEGGQAFADFKISQSKSEPEPSPLPAPVISYTVIAGDGSTWTKGSGADISFTFKRNATDEEVDKTFSHFVGVAVDGEEISSEYYDANEGSVIITLRQSFLEKLSVGEHVITAMFDDGSASASFSVTQSAGSSALIFNLIYHVHLLI